MTDKKSIDSRRNLLKTIAAGSGAIVAGKSLPDSWTKPVVDSVILPAHAQTSGLRTYFGGAVAQASISQNDMMLAAVAESFINDAHAGGPEIGEPNGTVCATEMADSFDVQYQNRADTVLRRGELPKTGSGILSFSAKSEDYDCGADRSLFDLTAEITEITDDYIDLFIDHRDRGGTTYRVMASPECNMLPLDGEGDCDNFQL